MKNVTIKDIAKVAKVSYATVSRALSDSNEISSETRKRILNICDEMGYTPNFVARSMVAKQTHLLGLIVGSINNPFMSELAYHVELHARQFGYTIMLCNSQHDTKLEANAFSLLLGQRVDGILIIPASTESRAALQPNLHKLPTVFISENLRDLPESYVSTDNQRGTFAGMEYLYGLGHRDILYFGRRKRSTTHTLRAKGYTDACKQYGLTPQFFDNASGESSIACGYRMGLNLFSRPFTFTAIFAATDTLALGILQAADECGVSIPGQVSLLGFDNITYAGMPRINLSSIEQPKDVMAAVAVEMLIERIRDDTVGYSHRVLQPRLIERGSCCPPVPAK